MDKTFYMMKYKCSNCLEGYRVDIPFKVEAVGNLECPNCGLKRVSPTKESIEVFGRYELNIENRTLVWKPLGS